MNKEFFEQLLTEHGDSPRALDWSEKGQTDRFLVLLDVAMLTDPEPVQWLDVGCGLGHFTDHAIAAGLMQCYIGIDQSKLMIEQARKRCKHPLCDFATMNALTDPLPTADYVVSSGMLNLTEWSNIANMRTLLKKCFNACTKGAAVNMLSSRAPKHREERFYYDPAWALAEALAITPYVTLRHDYRDNDFTLYLRRGPA